jgi:hypothetical protein
MCDIRKYCLIFHYKEIYFYDFPSCNFSNDSVIVDLSVRKDGRVVECGGLENR